MNKQSSAAKARVLKYGGYAAVFTLAVVVMAILANVLFQRLDLKLDLTESGAYTLSSTSINLVKNLSGTVTVYGLYQAGKIPRDITTLLDQYKGNANGKIVVEVIDPEKNPLLVAKYDPDRSRAGWGSLIVVGPDKRFRILAYTELYNYDDSTGTPRAIGFNAEARISTAIYQVTTDKLPVVYNIVGHGESGVLNEATKPLLDQEGMTIRDLNLVNAARVPEDADCIAIIAPVQAISAPELAKIKAYMEAGGRMLVMADFRARGINDLFTSFGIEIRQGVVIETDPNYHVPASNLILNPLMAEHDITKVLQSRQLFPLIGMASGIVTGRIQRRGLEIIPFMASSQASVLRVDLAHPEAPQIPDLPGPFYLGVLASDTVDLDRGIEARLAVVSSTTLLQPMEPFGIVPANIELTMSTLNWLTARKETMNLRTKSLISQPLNMNLSQLWIISSIIVFIIPIGLFVAGLVVWLRRRHL